MGFFSRKKVQEARPPQTVTLQGKHHGEPPWPWKRGMWAKCEGRIGILCGMITEQKQHPVTGVWYAVADPTMCEFHYTDDQGLTVLQTVVPIQNLQHVKYAEIPIKRRPTQEYLSAQGWPSVEAYARACGYES